MTRGKVLVVDDEDAIRELCRVNLELQDYEVREAADGVAALDVARRWRPDVIFLDLMMPRMDGWETLRHLKEDDTTASIPVVILTAKGSEEDQMKGWAEGVLEYVVKPFNPAALTDMAERAVAPRDQAAEQARRDRVLRQLQLVTEMKQRPATPRD